jgi:hypothetical protein
MIAARLEPDHFYDEPALRTTMGLRYNTMRRARLDGQLRSTRRGGAILYRGDWVMAWLEGQDAPANPTGKAVAAC